MVEISGLDAMLAPVYVVVVVGLEHIELLYPLYNSPVSKCRVQTPYWIVLDWNAWKQIINLQILYERALALGIDY